MPVITNSFTGFAFALGVFNRGKTGEVNYETGILLMPVLTKCTILILSGEHIMKIK